LKVKKTTDSYNNQPNQLIIETILKSNKFDIPDYYTTMKFKESGVLAIDDDDDPNDDNDVVIFEPEATKKKFLSDKGDKIILHKNQLSRLIESLTSSIMCSNSQAIFGVLEPEV